MSKKMKHTSVWKVNLASELHNRSRLQNTLDELALRKVQISEMVRNGGGVGTSGTMANNGNVEDSHSSRPQQQSQVNTNNTNANSSQAVFQPRVLRRNAGGGRGLPNNDEDEGYASYESGSESEQMNYAIEPADNIVINIPSNQLTMERLSNEGLARIRQAAIDDIQHSNSGNMGNFRSAYVINHVADEDSDEDSDSSFESTYSSYLRALPRDYGEGYSSN